MRGFRQGIGVVGALTVLLAVPQAAAEVHVTSSGNAGPGTLRDVIAAATPAETVVIDPGINPMLSAQIDIDKSVTIVGQGAGATAVTASGFTRLFAIGTVVQGISVRIEKLKMSGGRAPVGLPGLSEGPPPAATPPGSGGPGGNGGAILSTANQLALADVLLLNNEAGLGGAGGSGFPGGFFVPGAGGAGGNGGAIANSGTLAISGSTLVGNDAAPGGPPGVSGGLVGGVGVNGTAGNGGAIYNTGTLSISTSTIVANKAAPGNFGPTDMSTIAREGSPGGDGGAIYSTGTLRVDRSLLAGNSAGTGGSGASVPAFAVGGGSGGGGGAFLIAGGLAQITNSTLVSNTGGSGGGGGASPGPAIIGGTGGPGGSGGGIGVRSGASLVLAASTLSDNAAGNGGPGGSGATPGVAGSQGNGGALANGGTLTVRGSIVASNVSVTTPSCSGPLTDGGGNLAFPKEGGCTGFAVGDPKLDPAGFAPNGGPTSTIALQAGSAALNLVPSSSCLDAAGAPLTVDQRGDARPQAIACDAGAFQLTRPPTPPPVASLPLAKITKKPKAKVKTRKKKVRVSFSFVSDQVGSTFECKLDKRKFSSCRSPQAYKVRKGRHTLSVRAVSSAGTGPAATASFKVKRIKKKKRQPAG